MSKVDLSVIEMSVIECSELITAQSQKYECAWNDDVHDSFSDYNQKTNALLDTLSKIYESTRSINEDSFNNESYMSDSERLISEVDSL